KQRISPAKAAKI
ncbi:unnamed protein product, partial [Oikopleura dioica]